MKDAQRAEEVVAAQLRSEGWEILARNWRRRGCELDIVARRLQILAFIEVKFRRSYRPFASEIATMLNAKKIAALKRGALLFLAAHNLREIHSIRGDLAVVTCFPQKRSQNTKEHDIKIHYYNNILPL